MRPRTIGLFCVLLIAVAAVVGWQLAKDDDEPKPEQTVEAIAPKPFKGGLAFKEPPVLRSRGGVLRGTIVAKNGTIRVSGIKVANTQSYGIAGEQRGLLGPTLRVNPGDKVDLVLDNQLVQPREVGPQSTSDPQPMTHGGECSTTSRPSPASRSSRTFIFTGFT